MNCRRLIPYVGRGSDGQCRVRNEPRQTVGLGRISLGLLTSRGQNTPRRPLGLLSESSRMELRFAH
jgi:hypothetical protein